MGKTLLTAFLLLAIVPLALLAFATYNQIQSDTRQKVLASLETIVALEESHVVDWVAGCERELGLLAGLCDDAAVPGSEILAVDERCTVHAAEWLANTQAAALLLVQDGGDAVRVIVENGEVLGEGVLAGIGSAVLRDGVTAGELVTVPVSEVGQVQGSASGSQPLLAIGHRLAPSGASPSGTSPSGASPSGTSPSGTGPSGASPSGTGPSGTGPSGTGPSGTGPSRGGEQYLVMLYSWQSLQRLIGDPGQPDEMTRVSLATHDKGSGFWVFDFGETPSGQELASEGGSPAAVGDVGQKTVGGIEQALSGHSGSGAYSNQAGVPVLGAYRWNPRLQVAVVAEQPQTEALVAGNTLTAVLVAITLGMALVTAAIAAVVTRQVTRPIVQLTETAARMARGDLDQRVVVTRQDEIGVLARAFNRMAAELRVLYAGLNAKVEFLTNMSHALRTPLTSIIGFSRLMLKELDGPLTELQRTDLTAIHEGGQQLLELINDMLELSDVELETAPMTVDEVDLAGMVDGVMATGRALVLNKPVELVDEVAGDLPVLYTDTRRVRRVLLALVSNAIRITDAGVVRLSATAGDGQVTLRVQARGATRQAELFGQDPEMAEADGPEEGGLGRSGLGLTISQQMVEKLGGRIWVESNGSGRLGLAGAYNAALYDGPIAGEGAGSVFTLTLPISPSDKVLAPWPADASQGGQRAEKEAKDAST